MTHGHPTSKTTRTARRASRLDALAWLWSSSTLNRVRACRLHVADREAGATLQRMPDGSARWAGLQSCGSTHSCPVCADRIQAGRKADVAAMIDAAHARGLVVAFVTFTVRHRRTQSLREVWDEVSDAWRSTTSGGSGASQRAWKADREEFGIVGYLRLWETTHGDAGWHVHVHALLFLDPAGIVTTRKAPVPLADANFVGPLLEGQQRRSERLQVTSALRRVKHVERIPIRLGDQWLTLDRNRPTGRGVYEDLDPVDLPGLKGAWRRPEGPLPAPVLVADARKFTRTGPATVERIPSGRADDNWFADVSAGRSPRRGIYRRDVEALGARLFDRWRRSLPANMAPPAVCGDQGHDCSERRRREGAPHSHGWDARIVDDVDVLSEYFTKNAYTVKGVDSAALDVTSSTTKTARQGNRTPFGILEDLVAGYPGLIDDPEAAYDAEQRDRALWREWESTSKGRRQLRPSDGLRDLLGLGPEPTDEELAADEVEETTGTLAGDPLALASVPAAVFRRMAFSADATWALELVESADYEVLYQLLRGYGLDPSEDDVRPHRQAVAST